MRGRRRSRSTFHVLRRYWFEIALTAFIAFGLLSVFLPNVFPEWFASFFLSIAEL